MAAKKKDYALQRTEFAKESALSTTVAAPAALFTLADKPVDEKKLERLNLPRLLKPDQIPVWSKENPVTLVAKINKVIWSPNSAIKGFVLWLITPQGLEVTFPCTGVLRSALAPGIKIDDTSKATIDATKGELQAALEKHVGKTLYLKRTANQQNAKYKKEMFMFDVFVGKD